TSYAGLFLTYHDIAENYLSICLQADQLSTHACGASKGLQRCWPRAP
ncbi:hypothetical protein FLAG1_12217, partial [Fusarium langsethiae]